MIEAKTTSRLHPSSQGGFSLLEIMIAVMILALMGGLVATQAFPNLLRTRRARAQMECDTIKEAISLYRLHSKGGRLPEVSDFPQCITQPDDSNGGQPYLDPDKLTDGKLLDPWGTEYTYIKNGTSSFEIISYGEDCVQGGEGDAADISSKRTSEGSGGGSGQRPR